MPTARRRVWPCTEYPYPFRITVPWSSVQSPASYSLLENFPENQMLRRMCFSVTESAISASIRDNALVINIDTEIGAKSESFSITAEPINFSARGANVVLGAITDPTQSRSNLITLPAIVRPSETPCMTLLMVEEWNKRSLTGDMKRSTGCHLEITEQVDTTALY